MGRPDHRERVLQPGQLGGAATTIFSNDNTYTGGTLINGGTLALTDQGKLSGTTSIGIHYATLSIGNTGTVDLTDRVNNSAGITLRGAGLAFVGRALTASGETLGAVSAAEGLSTITLTAGGGTGINSADLTVAGFSQVANSGAMVNFTSASTLGTVGSQTRFNISGTTPASLVTAGTMVNNIIPWAVVGGTEFASYIPYSNVDGVAAGGIGAQHGGLRRLRFLAHQYLRRLHPGGDGEPENYGADGIAHGTGGERHVPGEQPERAGVTPGPATLNFAAPGDTINLTSGGLLHSGALPSRSARRWTTAASRPAAGRRAVRPICISTTTPAGDGRARVIDNPAGAAVRLVLTDAAGITTTLTNPNNSYSGGTVINGGTVTLTGATPSPGNVAAGEAEIPGRRADDQRGGRHHDDQCRPDRSHERGDAQR